MERNANDNFGSQSTSGSASGASFGSTSGSPSGAAGGSSAGTSDASFSRDATTDASGIADRARSAASTAGEKLADVGSTVRDRAGNLKETLASALETGAERLRQQGAGGGQVAGAAATGGSAGMVAEDSRLGQATNQLAGGMQGAADWLRDTDLDGLKSGIERQVKEHPGRTLAVAVGVGYLLGKALRK
jgi:ElaB/YqjD/DUF883 family membrane-anchored ribosome-binding protein